MKKVTRSNLKLSMPCRTLSVLREQAVAPWRFQPSDSAKFLPSRHGNHNKDLPGPPPCILLSWQRDMEIVTRALVRELKCRPDGGVISRTSNEKNMGPLTSEIASSSTSSCDPGSPFPKPVEAKSSASVEVSDLMDAQFEVPGTRTEALSRSCNTQRSIPGLNNFIGKRRSRRGNRAPITIMRADPANFEAMVQQMTGFPSGNNSRAAPSFSEPEPEWPRSDVTELD